ncbi:hypothetical protein JDV02_001453 [Purpureocillium takamizusanense]|uniref:Uncharacterized protein n=1 Tax=Purpureocillium takamizusanense TaxID=2060973 RepID=A0A9Q8V7H9_9HYPO|nr:uncharacterized protein JDV02_001453 [Purpureocillium takamizusanense]UNI14869.1 hypothetical protein JDV02_001453 [Purpureocillium takamizusanense]
MAFLSGLLLLARLDWIGYFFFFEPHASHDQSILLAINLYAALAQPNDTAATSDQLLTHQTMTLGHSRQIGGPFDSENSIDSSLICDSTSERAFWNFVLVGIFLEANEYTLVAWCASAFDCERTVLGTAAR